MSLEWESFEHDGKVQYAATSNAASWDELRADMIDALPGMLDEMAARLEADKQHTMLISLWPESGRLIFQTYRKGRLLSSARVSFQLCCQFITDAYDEHMADAPEDNEEILGNFESAFSAQVLVSLIEACETDIVRSAWGRLLERVGDCIVYTQRDDNDASRDPFMCLLPPDDK